MPQPAQIPKEATPAPIEKTPSTVSEKESPPVTAVISIPTPAATVPEAPKLKDAGRGGARHKSIQKRLKTEAEKLGFAAEAEKQLAKGSMQAADVVLRRGHIAIAVEITVTTGVDHEFGNVRKCLEAGFARVAVVSTGRKHLEAIAEAVRGGLGPEHAARVSYHTPDEFLDELRTLAATSEQPPAVQPMAAREKRGMFEVERNFPTQSSEEQKSTQQGIHDLLTKTMSKPPAPGSS